MRDKHPTTLFVDIVPKQNTKPTRRQRVSDYGRFLQILFFSIFYTLKILTMILYFAPLNLLPLLITAVLFFICVTMSFQENRYKKFTHYF
jgi:Flp pilus assembly protein TadB